METPSQIIGRYVGERGEIFWLSLKTSMLALITLGVYRFWARTRIRRYIWSSAVPDGDPFEYTGNGLEKFLGFLVAVVVLAIYLGITQLLLQVFGFNLFGTIFKEPTNDFEALAQVGATYFVLIALAPVILFAQYRARRYMASRTRWRGVRFAMDKAAWRYVLHGLLWLLITVLTLGIAWPVMSYKLEKFMTDRTWYGQAKLHQGGNWKMLFGAFKHVYFSILFLVGGIALGVWAEAPALAIISIIGGYVYMFVAFVYYGAQKYNRLTSAKVLDGEVTFTAQARTGRIVQSYLAFFGMAVLALIGSIIALYIVQAISGFDFGLNNQFDLSPVAMAQAGVAALIWYLLLLILWAALSVAFVSQPVLAHKISETTVHNSDHLASIQQRDKDDFADADGFADALDIGGAF